MQDIETYIWNSRQSLYRVAYTYVRNEQDALDIVSASIIKAMQAKPKILDERAMTAWVYRVVVNTAKDYLRKNKRLVIGVETEGCIEDGDPTLRMDLEMALNHLPEKYRTVVVLHYFEDMKLQDVAEITSEKLSTVKSRLHKALLLMKADAATPGPRDGIQ